MWVIRNRKFAFILSALLVGGSILTIFVFGIPAGIDFAGGSLTEVVYQNTRPDKPALEKKLDSLAIGSYSLRPSGSEGVGEGYILRTRDLSEQERQAVYQILSQGDASMVKDSRFTSVGPSIGSELARKAFIALTLVVLAIMAYVAFVFRKVSEPVASWKYGVITVVTLIHDVAIPLGLFALLGYFIGAEADVLLITALLTVLGYSVNDTIVVFDRVRENLRKNQEMRIKEPFENTVGKSLEQSYGRSLNTSITTLIAITALYFLGSDTTRLFALTLFAGVAAGAYSSIFVATPLLVALEKWQRKRS